VLQASGRAPFTLLRMESKAAALRSAAEHGYQYSEAEVQKMVRGLQLFLRYVLDAARLLVLRSGSAESGARLGGGERGGEGSLGVVAVCARKSHPSALCAPHCFAGTFPRPLQDPRYTCGIPLPPRSLLETSPGSSPSPPHPPLPFQVKRQAQANASGGNGVPLTARQKLLARSGGVGASDEVVRPKKMARDRCAEFSGGVRVGGAGQRRKSRL
jgi:hypothetical protein